MIRKLEPGDIARLTEIYHKIFTSSEWNYDWLTMKNVTRYLTDMSLFPRFAGFSFFNEKGEIIGACFGDISDYFSTVQYYIKEIFVEMSLQNKGVGSKFLLEVEAYLKKRGVNNVTLYTSKTIPAYKFYRKNGYTDSSDAVFMVKPL
ncbi:MAG: GNAT family N-acetyltransferase [Clostridiales bacterium]|nr:GNAT family N-acetyltransferase [Clostridiales bacterium]